MIVIGTIASQAGRPAISYTYASNTANAALTMSSISGYVAGKSDITITINAGIYLYSTSTATPGFALTGGATGDTVKIVNNGYIMGQGGTGGSNGVSGGAGGPALSLSFNTTVDNTNASAYIGGGGGGGASGTSAGGGGAGGGSPGSTSYGTTGTPGTPGVAGTGNAGGRIFPGATAPQAGGNGTGAAGGTNNNVGGTTITGRPYDVHYTGAGGGGWGASGGTAYFYAPGAGGKAVALNSKTVTWVSGDTTRVWGAVS